MSGVNITEILLCIAASVLVVAIYAIPMALEQRLTPRIAAVLLFWAGAMLLLVLARDWFPGVSGYILIGLGTALVGQSIDYVEASTRTEEPEAPNRYRAHEPLAVTRPSLRSWGLFAIVLLVLGAYHFVLPLIVTP
jgi:hypothetical protein